MSDIATAMPDPSLWQPQQLRLTAFPLDSAAALDCDWWQKTFGQPAETSTRKKLIRADQGSIGDKAVSLTVDPQRISWTIDARIDPLDPPPPLPTLGSLLDVVAKCGELFKQAIGCLPEVRRMALGAILLQPVDDRESGYRRLDLYLPDVRVNPESWDFQYRINRRRPSSVDAEMYINRLSAWSVLRWKVRTEIMVAGESRPASPLTEGEEFACRLELDINTPAEREEPLPGPKLSAIWAELIDLAVEIATTGDIP